MEKLRPVVVAVRRVEVPLYFAAAVLGLYVAGGSLLRGAKIPDEEFWAPWSAAFVGLLAGALFVPLYTLYKALDARLERLDKNRAQSASADAELTRDLELACQRAVAEIAEHCPAVDVNHLAASVWLCQPDGTFERRARFLLPHERKRSGTVWGRGRGVAGMAWATNCDLRTDLRPLYRRLEELGPEAFDALDPGERLGLTAREVENSRDYAGICALRLFGADEGTIVGIFVVDYTGRDHFGCVAEASADRRVKALLGGCEDRLSAAAGTL